MKKKLLYLSILFLFTGISFSQTVVKELLTENLVDPIGLDVAQPRFTWIMESQDRGIVQTAYEIEVQSNNATVWSSGQVVSDSSVLVAYKGMPLTSNTQYTWKVRVWDNKGSVSSWSLPAKFHTGFLNQSDWEAQWIGPGFAEDTINRPSPYFRKNFSTNKSIKSATLYITAHGMYEAYLNGERVGNAYYTPGWTSYHKRLQYQVYDVTDMILQNNAVGVILASGWYRGSVGGGNKVNNYGRDVSLLLQIEIVYDDGTVDRVVSDPTWKSSTGKITYSEIYHGEKHDLRLEKEGWMLPGYDDTQWFGVTVADYGMANLTGTVSEPVREHEVFKPVRIFTTPIGEKVIDFGQNLAGWVRMKVKGNAGDSITLSHAEVLDPAGNFYTENLRSAKAQCVYTLNGSDSVVLHPHFTWHGFRYVKVENYPGEIKPENFEAVALYSSLETTGNFTSSNAMINQLQSNILWSQKSNFIDIPTDCPQRDERLGWTGDIQVYGRTAAFNMRAHNFLSKWLRDLEADQLPTGEVPNYIPDLQSNINRAGWADASTIVPWTLYRSYGDTRVLRNQYNSMKAYVESVRSVTNNDLWDTGLTFGDWLPPTPEPGEGKFPYTNKYIITQCYYAHSLQIMMNTAKVLGNTADEAYYADLYEKAKKAFHKAFINTNGDLISQSQTAYSLSLGLGLIPDSLEAQAAATLVRLIYDYGHVTTGFLATAPLIQVLTKYGYTALAYRLLERKSYPSWLFPITRGATTCWERWDGILPDGNFQTENPRGNSFNHYLHGAVGDWMYSKMAGLDMSDELEASGYKHIRIKPVPGGTFDHARASLKTYYGMAVSGWQIKGNRLEMEVEVPVNTQATVYLPSTDINDITESGNPIVSVRDIQIMGTEEGIYTLIQVGSGKYIFSFPYQKIPVEPDPDDLTQVIAAWSFDWGSTGPSYGAGTFNLTGGIVTLPTVYYGGIAPGVATIEGISPESGSGKSISTKNYPTQGTNRKTAGFEITINTTGYKDIKVTADIRHGSASANTFVLQYSTDGGINWIDANKFNKVVVPNQWYLRPFDFSSISAVNNQPELKLRYVTDFDGDKYVASDPLKSYSPNGDIRYDNIKVIGVIDENIPIPATVFVSKQHQDGIRLVGNKIIFPDLPCSRVVVYNISGIPIKSYNPAKEVELNLNKGIYIVGYDSIYKKIILF